MKYLIDVHAFHERFDVPCPMSPTWPSNDLINFRMEFIDEEVNEINRALNEKDMEGFLDGLVDLVYVTLGAALTFGLDFDEAWARVQRANMEKVAVKNTAQEGRHKTDVVKPEGWKPPRFKDLVDPDYVRPPLNNEAPRNETA